MKKKHVPELVGLMFEDADDAYAALMGSPMDASDARTVTFYEDLRRLMNGARRSANLTQADVGELLGKRQSEVSRFENSLGPGTQIGTAMSFLHACKVGARIQVVDADGNVVGEAELPILATPAVPDEVSVPVAEFAPPVDTDLVTIEPFASQSRVANPVVAQESEEAEGPKLEIEGHVFTGTTAIRTLEFLGAFNSAMQKYGIPSPRRAELAREALNQLSGVRQEIDRTIGRDADQTATVAESDTQLESTLMLAGIEDLFSVGQ